MDRVIEKIASGGMPDHCEIAELLRLRGDQAETLRRTACCIKYKELGNRVFLRGLVEFSNVCSCDCLYCGIRKSNVKISRYTLSDAEILDAVHFSAVHRYGAVVLQSGERRDGDFIERVARLVREIKKRFPELGITLSCGEETLDVYKLWRNAGADRYLLRIESSNPTLFRQIHDAASHYAARKQALDHLRTAGFTVGSGVMIGIPGQTIDDLAADLEFFRDQDLDMIGMGPFLAHGDTPLGQQFPDTREIRQSRLELALNMIALTRLMLRDVNIAAATSLQAIAPTDGRQRGILAGANVIMPNVGETVHRKDYLLYDHKPGIDENAETARKTLERSLQEIGEEIAYGNSGTPLHYTRRSTR